MKHFSAPALKKWIEAGGIGLIQKETGSSLKEWLEPFQGEIAIGFDPDYFGDHAQRSYWVLLADIGDNAAAVRRLMKSKPASPSNAASSPAISPAREATRFYEGVELTLQYMQVKGERYPLGGWAIVGTKLVMAATDADLERTVHALAVPPSKGQRLADSTAYRSFVGLHPAADALVYVNCPEFLKQTNDYMAKELPAKGSALLYVDFPYAFFSLTPSGISHVLGTDLIESLGGFLTMDDASTSLDIELSYRNRAGLLRLLAFRPESPSPDLVPESAAGELTCHFDFAQAWMAATELAGYFHISQAAMRSTLTDTRNQLRVDLEHDVVAALGSQVSFARIPLEPAAKDMLSSPAASIVVVELNDADRLKTALAKLTNKKQQKGNILEVDRSDDTPIYRFSEQVVMDDAIDGLRFAVVGHSLLLTWEKERDLASMARKLSQPDRKPFWKRPISSEIIDRVPNDAVGLGSCDGAAAMWMALAGIAHCGIAVDEFASLEHFPESPVINKYLPRVLAVVSSNDRHTALRVQMFHPVRKSKGT